MQEIDSAGLSARMEEFEKVASQYLHNKEVNELEEIVSGIVWEAEKQGIKKGVKMLIGYI